ncbi:DNA mismatch repair protein MutT [Rhizobium sp. Root708]|uniref:NUDIX hydrolase n=1 Tax=Rhizobium sp. Root708 TaxID=1736592 RepID=UPI0006F6E16E|nr:NUDIX hydrolase [Rhizobium sp. Root708]KRB61532.1 DNA mismatch repair protein MutT [Rhizobium sp. Root708]
MLSDDQSNSAIPTAARDIQQAGAICYRRNGSGQLRVLLVGSRRNGRWGVPKGHLDPGETTSQAAGRESFEEAGVVGDVETTIFGSFSYHKDSSPHHYHVTVHLLQVAEAQLDFPEKGTRKQKWFPLKVAIRDAAQPGLRALLSRLEGTQL